MTCNYFIRQHLIFFIQVYPLSFIPMRRNCRRPCLFYLENPFLYIARLWLQLPRVNSLYRFKSALYIHTSIIQIRELCPLCGCYEMVSTSDKTTCLGKLPLWCFSHLQFSSASGVEKFMKEGVKVSFSP